MSDSGLFLWPDWRLEADDAPVIDTEDTPGRGYPKPWPTLPSLQQSGLPDPDSTNEKNLHL